MEPKPPLAPNESPQKLIDALQSDFRYLASEGKKNKALKESCEEAIAVLKNATANNQSLYYIVNQVLYPVIQGCETKDLKIIKFCLGLMQRLITRQVIDQKGARYIIDILWRLMETEVEEVKVLQTVILLLTTNTVVQGETLSKAIVVCFRLHFTKDSTTINTAGATVRQLVTLVFDRMVHDDKQNPLPADRSVDLEALKTTKGVPPKGLYPSATDAFLLFQDLVQLVDADQPYWLLGMTEMTRTFGLELLEAVLTNFSVVFEKYPEFCFLLKERVCALVIKLFSPHIKHRSNIPPNIMLQTGCVDKPYFPISMRLLRVVSILIQKYHHLLVTECEIFLSLIVKFLDIDKPAWQRALALEVLHKIVVQPMLIVSFCECYDMKDHSTNILQDIVNSLGSYVQHSFAQQNVHCAVNPSNANGTTIPYAGGSSTQSGFSHRGIWLPLTQTFPQGQTRSQYLEMLDKMEPPIVPDGYGISVAYASILDLVNSISNILHETVEAKHLKNPKKKMTEQEKKVIDVQILTSTSIGLLVGLYLLGEAATDESTTDSVLKSMQTFTAMCGVLGLEGPRDSFVIALCHASLPPHYATTILNMNCHELSFKGFEVNDIMSQYTGPCTENDFKHQVVAIGTPLPTTSLPIGAQLGPVMLTAKNLQCMRALLHLALCHGVVLKSSWNMVLLTLQHLAWILGLKPQTGGSLQVPPKTTTDSNAITQIMAELPVLSSLLSQLFESTQHLDEESLHYLIQGLSSLSQEAMELAYTNREPSLFAVAKLLETGLINLFRVETYWKALTGHLLEVSVHPHTRIREWGVEAITYLVKSALQYKYDKPLKDNAKLQTLLLSPLSELSSMPHSDVRQRQLECVLQILNGSGEMLSHGWPLILGIIGVVNDNYSEILVRLAFQCLQLVITDFLPAMPWRCLPLCINTASRFASKSNELNISLTAIGLMWNISDYFNQNRDKLSQPQAADDFGALTDFSGVPNLTSFDKLWMCLYARLGELCTDIRPAVRKSAGQTLFSTISAHGALLSTDTWQLMFWQVLFPLLDKVRQQASQASTHKVDTTGNILIHHSRNTAQKQWAETQVLTLSGVSRVFTTKKHILQNIPNFQRGWCFLLDVVEFSALSKNNEVSLAALKAFQEILYSNSAENGDLVIEEVRNEMWMVAWKFWLNIGLESTKVQINQQFDGNKKDFEKDDFYVPSQAFLTALVQILPALFQHVKSNFSDADLAKLCTVLTNTVTIPVHNDAAPYIISTQSDTLLSPLYESVLDVVEFLQKEFLADSDRFGKMLVVLLQQLMIFSKYACIPPSSKEKQNTSNTKEDETESNDIEWINMNYVPFGEKSITMLTKLYKLTSDHTSIIESNVLQEIVQTLKVPLALKYKCYASSTWKLSINSLITILRTGLKVARKHPKHFTNMWKEVSETFDAFLFPKSVCAADDRGLEELVLDETIDCQVIELIRDHILPNSSELPEQFVKDIVILLNKGSIHSLNRNVTGSNARSSVETEFRLREDFAKICFETLLHFSLLNEAATASVATATTNGTEQNNKNNNDLNNVDLAQDNFAGRLAVTALLYRFEEILKKFNDDEQTSGKFPLPRYRTSEISFVLKSIATLAVALKKAKSDRVGESTWRQLIGLYPYLVDCSTTSSAEVLRSLREALLQYGDLLQPPKLN